MKKVGGDLHLSVGFWCFLQSRMAMTTAMMSSTRHADTIDTIRIVDALLISFNSPIPATTMENLLNKRQTWIFTFLTGKMTSKSLMQILVETSETSTFKFYFYSFT